MGAVRHGGLAQLSRWRGWRSMTDVTMERALGLPEPGSPPGLTDQDDRPPAEPAVALREGVELTRLLALVRLTAPQALELGAGLLAEIAGRTDVGPGTPDGDPVGPDRAIVGTDGQVLLGPAPDHGRGTSPPVTGSTDAALVAVLADVARAARLPGRPAEPAAEQLLTELDRAATDLPDAGVPAVAARLQETVAAIDRTVVRRELAALVRAISDRSATATATATGPAPAGGPPGTARTAPPRRVRPKETRATVRRIGAWLLSVVVLAGGVVVEVAVLRDDITADVAVLLDAGRSGSAPSTATEPDGLPIVPPAPAAAGSVAAVDLRSLVQCAPATPCALRLQVRLVPGPDPRAVSWSYRLIDRCTGAAATVPGGTVTVPAGQRRVAVVGTVALPDQQAVAVVAVTGLPAVAASPPVFAGSCLPDQPTG